MITIYKWNYSKPVEIPLLLSHTQVFSWFIRSFTAEWVTFPGYKKQTLRTNVYMYFTSQVNNKESTIKVYFTPTIPHCSMATLIGLSLRVKLQRSLPPRFKVSSFLFISFSSIAFFVACCFYRAFIMLSYSHHSPSFFFLLSFEETCFVSSLLWNLKDILSSRNNCSITHLIL